jgi:hypothetical protein
LSRIDPFFSLIEQIYFFSIFSNNNNDNDNNNNKIPEKPTKTKPMSAPIIKAEPFQFPPPIEGCDCTICSRGGVDANYREPVSVFEQYQVETVGMIPPQTSTPCTSAELEEFQNKHEKSCDWLLDGSHDIRSLSWHRICSSILKKMLKQKDARVFKEPVDWQRLNLPEYPRWIKHPMDLGTIDRRLHGDNCRYTNPDDFVADVRMVFRNAYLFNPEGNPVRNWARTLSLMFEEDLLAQGP